MGLHRVHRNAELLPFTESMLARSGTFDGDEDRDVPAAVPETLVRLPASGEQTLTDASQHATGGSDAV